MERLKITVETFAGRESRVEHDFNLQSHNGKSEAEERIARLQEDLARELEQTESRYAAALDLARKRARNREKRIEKLRKSAQNQLVRGLSEEESHRVYDLQMSMMQAQRNLKSEREKAYREHQEFSEALDAVNQQVFALRKAAHRALRGFPSFLRRLREAGADTGGLDPEADESVLLAQLGEATPEARREVSRFGRRFFPALFRSLPAPLLALLALLAGGGAGYLLRQAGREDLVYPVAGGIGIGGVLLVVLLYFIGKSGAAAAAESIIARVAGVRGLAEACEQKSSGRLHGRIARLEQELNQSTERFESSRKHPVANAGEKRETLERVLEEKGERIAARHERMARERIERLERERTALLEDFEVAREEALRESRHTLKDFQEKLESGYRYNWEQLEADWKQQIAPLVSEIETLRAESGRLFPAWEPENWSQWQPPEDFANAARAGHLQIDLEQLCGGLPKNPRLAFPGGAAFSLPVALTLPRNGSVFFETGQSGAGRDEVIAAMNNLILRLLTVTPPAKLGFTIIDPVGLGESFSGIMHLADYDEQLINSRIWTQTEQIERRLADLNEHMEKVIQMYLRNEYETIAEYNEKAGAIAEKYHFVVVADFPVNFSEIAAKRLLSIATSGARCGVYTIIHHNRRNEAVIGVPIESLEEGALSIRRRKEGFTIKETGILGEIPLALDPAPAAGLATDLVHQLGEASASAERVEVPFDDVAPPEGEMWSRESTRELVAPIGRTGATKFQNLAIGKGTCQHTLVAGKTGSGKSTLFHVMITNMAAWFPPEQVEFYLVDFKKGVEFKAYANARLPHARVIAIESDREFGLSVLQRVDEELKRRGDLFRKLGVQDVPGYKKAGGAEEMPRTVLLIDEFQELFVEDDRIAQNANLLLDRIVRQGRAFGIHVILGSQTLGGAYTLARTTLGQMVIRIALQCNESDAYLIMDDTNPAPRLLTRPGEGIYNDQAGMIEGNSPFQVVWLPDEVREKWLGKVREQAATSGRDYPDPIVFEGNAPAEIRENAPLRRRLEQGPATEIPAEARAWLGAPNSIKGPTEALFRRLSGNNLMIVGQREESALSLIAISILSLASQHPVGGIRFLVLDSSAPATPERDYLDAFAAALPHRMEVLRGHETSDAVASLSAELESRGQDAESGTAPPVFVFIHGLQKLKKLRFEEDFSFSLDESAGANPGAQLDTLIREGSSSGIHLIVTCDTYNNISRSLSRKALSEFEMRVVFQMSANDSASLIDSPKASNLGLHRALLYNEQEGYLETFRPYALPDRAWIEEAAGRTA